MTRVRFHGWRYRLRKVALTKLFQRALGVGLAAAKHLTDRVLAREEVIVEVESTAAGALVREARELGAECEIVGAGPAVVDAANR